jgi:hypothetical protein
MYGGADVVHCEFELRDDSLMWFSPGLALIRDRAFQTREQRQAFLDSARRHLQN